MSKVIQSVRGVVQGTLHRRKPHLMISARVKDSDGSLNDAIQEIEKLLVDRIGSLKAAVSEDQGVVAREAQHAEQVIEGLKANITMLETKLRETEDTVRRKEAASQKLEENLSCEIRDLQSAVKKKEEALETRESEINVLKSKIDVMTVQVSRLESAIEHAKADAASEAQRAEQVNDGLKTNIAALEARLRETEETIHQKDVASQKLEENLSVEIRDLQSVVKKKEEALESRESEVTDLKSKLDVMVDQVTHLQLANDHAKEAASSKAQHVEQAIEGLKMKIATLQAQLSQTEQIVGGLVGNSRFLVAGSAIKELGQERISQAADLKTELEPLRNGMKHSEAQALIDTQAQAIGTLVEREQSKTGEEKSTAFQVQAEGVTPIVTEAAPQTVSKYAFDRMIAEFSELSNVMGSIASLIIRDHVRALGESMEEFPQARLTELLESLGKGISDDKLKADFRERFGKV
jgi:predicted RNase H-like nuclease (RuvC/YqgF family)